jgi:hypothetical protein
MTILAGKFGAFFASIPLPIFAAIYCILFGIVGKSECPPWVLAYMNLLSNFGKNLPLLPNLRTLLALSRCGSLVHAVHQQKLHQEHLHHWAGTVPWHLNPSILQ